MKLKRLPETELTVMQALWAAEAPAPRAALDAALAEECWSVNTVNTYLSRLTDKGFVSCEKRGKSNYYTPLVSRQDYLAFESGQVVDKLFGKSVTGFVAALSDGGRLSDDQADELRRYLDRLREAGGPK